VSLDKYAAVREKPSRYLMLPALHVGDDVAYTDSEFAVVDKEASSIRAQCVSPIHFRAAEGNALSRHPVRT
jgi:hypothetical protein